MTSKEMKEQAKPDAHQKHAKLARPEPGEYHRNEWAILGTPCTEIRKLADLFIASVSGKLNPVYLDADHKGDESGELPAFLKTGAGLEMTDKISFFRMDLSGKPGQFQLKTFLAKYDAVIVNGNHFTASRQIVVVDPRKDLLKKIGQLTNVCLILLAEGQESVPAFLQEAAPAGVPTLRLSDAQGIAQWFIRQLENARPEIRGLVLAGGKSSRMNTDKGLIFYHDRPQREYLHALLSGLGLKTFMSVRADQVPAVPAGMDVIADSFLELGPYGALLSAFRQHPSSAWLAVACDLPLLRHEHLQLLLDRRNVSKVATAFYNPATDFPEPLVTLWEPRAYPVLLQFLSQGYSCPRKVLINSEVELVKSADTSFLMNANTPEDREKASILLAGSAS